MQHQLICYAEGRGDQWEALCLDFDLAVHGRSFEEVYSGLNRAIDEYLDYVRDLPSEEQARFLHRRVPLSTRLGIALCSIFSIVIGRPPRNGAQRHDYTVACPA